MKKNALFFVLYIIAYEIYGQKNNFSTEINVNYTYYFVGENNSNNLNYGFSLFASKYIQKLKLSTGINYAIKSYNSQSDQLYSIQKREYNLKYLNIPIIANIDIFSQNKFISCILTGIAFNQITDFNIKTYYLNGETITDINLLSNRKLGLSFMLGTTFSLLIGDKYLLNLSPVINYKLIPDHDNQRPNYKNIPNDKVSIDLKFGVEYIFNHIE